MDFRFAEPSAMHFRRLGVLVDPVAELASATGTGATRSSTPDVMAALQRLGYEPVEIQVDLHRPVAWIRTLLDGAYEAVFNLCEGLGGRAEGEHLPAAAVELTGLPMTGAPAACLLYSLDKDRCSAMLRAHDIPVPTWRRVARENGTVKDWERFPVIVKPAAQDASNGVHPNSIARSPSELVEAVDRLLEGWHDLIIQEFIDGREINTAILGDRVLPPAEIDFSGLAPGDPAIVSYAAKWIETSVEYRGTVPVCPAPLEPELAGRIEELTIQVWRLMGGRGYGRIDFRVDHSGQPFVIDVNPNPDLSPDAGLARQARTAGWTYDELILQIVQEALSRGNGRRPSTSTEPLSIQRTND